MTVTYYCTNEDCLARRRVDPFIADAELPCERCGLVQRLTATAAMREENRVDCCAACGEVSLYIQKDFHQGLGCAILAVGAVLAFWTYGISVVVFALVDLVLYYTMPDVTICYACFTEHRRVARNPEHAIYNLLQAHKVLRQREKQQAS